MTWWTDTLIEGDNLVKMRRLEWALITILGADMTTASRVEQLVEDGAWTR